MAAPPASKGEPITDRRQLVDYLAGGCKPPADWRIGTEHEKFGYRLDDLGPLPYEGEQGIGAILTGLQRFGWQPILEGENVIALQRDGESITLEPGGQFELSGAMRESIHQTCSEVNGHLAEVKEVTSELGVGMLGIGFQPKWARQDISWMPKGRYRIMGDYMPKKGNLGLDMMLRSCTVQVNLDFSSEADMVKKLRVGLALQPVATAIFANSPFSEGAPNGYLSYRSHLWTDTDPDRTGMLPFVFEDGMGFERYVDYALDVPMYFVYWDGTYLDCAGQSFRDFLAGKLPALPGEIPGMGHWVDHLTTIFPEVRLKRFLEMRGADGGPWRRLCALSALWVGVMYDQAALDAAWDLCKSWTEAERQQLRDDVPREALNATIRGRSVRDVAEDMVSISRAGLHARGRLDSAGTDESGFLEPLVDIVRCGRTAAEELLNAYETRWQRSIDPVFTELAY